LGEEKEMKRIMRGIGIILFCAIVGLLLAWVMAGSVGATILDEDQIVQYANNQLIVRDSRTQPADTRHFLASAHAFPLEGNKLKSARISGIAYLLSEMSAEWQYLIFYQHNSKKIITLLVEISQAKKLVILLTGLDNPPEATILRTTNAFFKI